MNKYTPLHCHSDASLLDGLSHTTEIAKRLIEIGADGGALTDHGSIGNSISFTKAMTDNKLKPVLGIELYLCDQHATVKNDSNRKLLHMVILAKNTAGWQQILKIVQATNNPDHYYYKPRISLNQLSAFLDGNIIGFSGHLGSHISYIAMTHGVDAGVKAALQLQDMFGKGNFWLECQLMDRAHNPEMVTATDLVRQISAKTGIPCIATPDAHYCSHEDSELQRIILCSNMKTTFKKALSPDFQLRGFFVSNNYHIPTYDEMLQYGHTPEELENTNVILSQIEEYKVLQEPQLPEFTCPNGMSPDDYLRQLCREGWKEIIATEVPKEKWDEYKDRVVYELSVLSESRLSSYFLILWDVIQFCKRKGWLTGPGRGSAAGCIVSYLIGITQIDPIEHGLIFERFYDVSRKGSMPDIDLDVMAEHRAEIQDYLREKYGQDRVTQIMTYQNMKGARALSEVMRAYGDIPHEEIKRITSNIIEESRISDELQEMQELTGESSIIRWCLENRAKQFEEWCKLDDDGNLTGPYSLQFGQAIALEGVKAAQSKHAAGIVISPKPLNEMCPLILDTKTNNYLGGWVMGDMEAAGLVKMDLLSINVLDKMAAIHKMNPAFIPNCKKIPLDDYETWELIKSGKTLGVFQFDSKLGQSSCKKLMPENIEHLSALSAAMRPGCISQDSSVVTNITTDNSGKIKLVKTNIKKLYQQFQNQHPLYKSKIISYDENNHRFVENKIVNMWFNGIKRVYKIKFRKRRRKSYCENTRQYNLECTSDHKLFVYGKGWVELQHMVPGDRFAVLSNGEGREQPGRQTLTKNQKNFGDICFQNYEYKCIFCDWQKGSLDVNHIIDNRTVNNNPDNLCYMCPNHHREYTEKSISIENAIFEKQKYKLPQNKNIFWAEFAFAEYAGEKEVYDIEVEHPHHSFIAGDVVVHNCMESLKEDGKSITDHYIMRKNNLEPVSYIHESLEPILGPTYGEMIYQEQALRIAKDIAGFSLGQANTLRKAIGKKKADIMAKVKGEFLEGIAKTGIVPMEIGEQLFEWIEKSQRYSFNKSHSMAYSHISYLSAYAKTHFTKEFFTAYLLWAHARPKPFEEIYQLVNDAKSFGIYVMPPSLRRMNARFALIEDKIYFGLSDIKHVGESVITKMGELMSKFNVDVQTCSWIEFLIYLGDNLNSRAVEAMINAGACDCFNLPRIKMLYEYNIYKELSSKPKIWINTYVKSLKTQHKLHNLDLQAILEDAMSTGTGKLAASHDKRGVEKLRGSIESLANPPYTLVDKPHQIAQMENTLLGVCVTATFLDETNAKYKANCSCQQFNEGFSTRSSYISIACQIDGVIERVTKRGRNPGQEMASIVASDDSGIADGVVVFPESWAKYKDLLVEGNRVLLTGKRDKNGSSLSVETVEQI